MNSAQPPSIKIHFDEALQLLRQQGLLIGASSTTPDSQAATPELTVDSRLATHAHIFLAYRGVAHDGHQHIATLQKSGVAAIICEDVTFIDQKIPTPWLQVTNARAAWAWLSALAFKHPQRHMRFIGVTGTNGKTSTAWYCRQLLQQFGIPAVTIGTLGMWLGDEFIPSQHTTPDPPVLFAILARAKAAGINIVVMECSSHAIAQHKLDPLKFDALAFTSFTRDHLDLHGSMPEYFATKWRLFENCTRPDARMVFASAIPETIDITKLATTDVWCYGLNADNKAKTWNIQHILQVSIQSLTARDSHFSFVADGEQRSGCAALPADYATENLAAATLLTEGIVGKKIPPAYWQNIIAPPGRMQVVAHEGGPIVIVDYAHTPDALEKTLSGARALGNGRLWVVFGCGGDRDRGKRPQMGEVASRLTDKIIITSDNPRTENPDEILNEIDVGISERQKVRREIDRAKAIQLAIAEADAADVIVIAGKGHENYQIIGDKTLSFDDTAVAKQALMKVWS